MPFTPPARLKRLDPSGLPGWQRHVLLLIAFTLFAAPLVGYKALNDTKLSVYDEWQYADRVHQVMEGNIFMSDGEAVSRWGEYSRVCRGTARLTEPAPCFLPPEIPETPNYAGSDPPPYFVATGLAADVLHSTGIVDNALNAARLIGIIWAGLSMWCVWLLARAFGANRAASVLAASTVVDPQS